jgi:hypothetical protein
MSLDDKLEDSGNKLFKLSLVGLVLELGNEIGLQLPTSHGLIDYNWLTGHLSDFGFPLQMTSISILITRNLNNYIKSSAYVLPALTCTMHEYFPFDKSAAVFDPQDIMCYWAAAGIAAAVAYFDSSNLSRYVTSNFHHINILSE